MTQTQTYALQCLRDYTNPYVRECEHHLAKSTVMHHYDFIAVKLEGAKAKVEAHMTKYGTTGITAALALLEGKATDTSAAYILAAGAWHDLPGLLTGQAGQKLRTFRKMPASGANRLEWTALVSLVGNPEPAKKRKPQQ